MYCPKCKQKFDEGSRRFCPTDGSRLVSEAVEEAGSQKSGGVFANLIPKMDAISDLSIPKPGNNPSNKAEAPIGRPTFDMVVAEDLFDLDEDIMTRPLPQAQPTNPGEAATKLRPIARKVEPFEIPAGHVDLGDSVRTTAFSTEFDPDHPEGFVGKNVKGRYHVIEFLGGDESGIAYLADDKIVEDRKVLVRILLDDDQDEIMDSILSEERVSLSHFSHPNIARLIDSGQFTDGTDYLITEYFDALSVDDILGIHGRIGELRAARVIRQVAGALNEAHQEGILHRDLRPGNLIIDATSADAEQTKLVNFGASNGEPNSRNMGYKAPEVLGARVPTISSDIYSLAVVAYEMLTGSLPFTGETPKEIVRSQNTGLQLLPSEVRPELPVAVDQVLEKALAFNAADRYPKARDFGDAFYAAITELPQKAQVVPVAKERPEAKEAKTELIDLSPAVTPLPVIAETQSAVAKTAATIPATQPAWKNRSPEPPETGSSRTTWVGIIGLVALVAFLALGWYYIVNRPPDQEIPAQSGTVPEGNAANSANSLSAEMPPMPRDIPQPPNTSFYENTKQNLQGDLLLNFVGFKMYYPKEWKVNGPTPGTTGSRGKFLDISRSTPDDRLKEQMLVSYYPSKGTISGDAAKFPEMLKETIDSLKKLPGFRMVSQGETKINGDWKAYEVKFEALPTVDGEKVHLWGRRLFVPAARPGVRNGFEITMLATSLADDIHSPDDVGVKGELSGILYTFEPSQNF